MVKISVHCFTPPESKSGKSYNGEQSDKVDIAPVVFHVRCYCPLQLQD